MMEAINNLREATQLAIDAISQLQNQLAAQQAEIDKLKRNSSPIRPRLSGIFRR